MIGADIARLRREQERRGDQADKSRVLRPDAAGEVLDGDERQEKRRGVKSKETSGEAEWPAGPVNELEIVDMRIEFVEGEDERVVRKERGF